MLFYLAKDMSDFFRIPIKKHIFILAILARVLVMPFLYHPDIKIYNFQSSFLSTGVVNIYKFLDEKKQELPYKEEFVYQPLAYLFLGSFQYLLKPFLGNSFEKWLWDASQQSIESIGVYRFYFLLKLPLLIFDILTAFILASFFVGEEDKKRAFYLWILNPFSIFIIYAYSGFDVIVSFIVLAALFFARKGNLVLSAFLLVLGSLFKAYPLLFLPLIIFKGKGLKEILKMILMAVFVLVSVLLPFSSFSFVSSALNSGLMNRILTPVIDLGFGVKIIVPVLLLLFIYVDSRYKSRDTLVEYFFLVSIFILSFIHFHIQWLIWALPLFVLIWVRRSFDEILALSWLLFVFITPFLYDDKQMTVSLFSSFSYYFNLIPYPFVVVQRFYDPYYLQSLLQTAASSLAIFLLWKNINTIKN